MPAGWSGLAVIGREVCVAAASGAPPEIRAISSSANLFRGSSGIEYAANCSSKTSSFRTTVSLAWMSCKRANSLMYSLGGSRFHTVPLLSENCSPPPTISVAFSFLPPPPPGIFERSSTRPSAVTEPEAVHCLKSPPSWTSAPRRSTFEVVPTAPGSKVRNFCGLVASTYLPRYGVAALFHERRRSHWSSLGHSHLMAPAPMMRPKTSRSTALNL